MSNFCSDQGRTRVFGEAHVGTLQPETREERRSGQKWPFMNGHQLILPLNIVLQAKPFKSFNHIQYMRINVIDNATIPFGSGM
jgi:hypothetical protein